MYPKGNERIRNSQNMFVSEEGNDYFYAHVLLCVVVIWPNKFLRNRIYLSGICSEITEKIIVSSIGRYYGDIPIVPPNTTIVRYSNNDSCLHF